MTKSEIAAAAFKEGYNCSQAVLSAFAPEIGLEREAALRVATGFGGGIGRMAGTCGAVTGAVMVLGLRHGSVDPGDRQAKEVAYTAVREFVRRFEEKHGTVTCAGLLGCDISRPEGLAAAREASLFAQRCPLFVADAARILEPMLQVPAHQ
jgi:C_GCAxxG_C_C family probable redox protein